MSKPNLLYYFRTKEELYRAVLRRTLDMWLWNRGQAPRYKARPRHRTRTVFY